MGNRKSELIKEIEKMREEFRNNQDIYENYYQLLASAYSDILNYENLLNEKRKFQKLRNQNRLIFYLLFIIEACFMYLMISFNLPLIKFNILFCLGIIFPIGLKAILSDTKLSKNLSDIEKKINVNKLNYEYQKELIPIYIKKMDKLRDYTVHDLLTRINVKEVELFQLNENDQQEVKSIIDKIYQFPVEEELDFDTKEIKPKTLVKKRIPTKK